VHAFEVPGIEMKLDICKKKKIGKIKIGKIKVEISF
jgi:hypothetical protein